MAPLLHRAAIISKLSGDKRLVLCAPQCDAGIGTNALFQQLYRTPPKVLVLGAGCSAVSGATAQVSHLWNLVQVCAMHF